MWYSTDKMKKEVEDFKARTHNLSPEMREEQFEKEAEEGWKKIQDCVLDFKVGADVITEGGRFDTLSLGTWIEIVKAAGLAYVPIQMVALPDTIEVFKSNFEPVELDTPQELLKFRGMVRLDSCGSQKLKLNLSFIGDHSSAELIQSAIMKNDKYYFEFDERTTHALLEYVGQINPDGNTHQPIWWRPWVEAIQIDVPRPKFMGKAVDTWPLEWRVIIQKGEIAAISVYYIQAPVSLENPVIEKDIRSIIKQSQQLLRFIKEKGIQPWHPRYIDIVPEDEINFSFDFISGYSGPVFLEAGPMVPVDENNIPRKIWGAHPCFFLNKTVKGIALSNDLVLPLEQFVGN